MIALLAFLVALGALNTVGYLRSADAAIRIWRRREGINCYRVYAHAESRGWRVRTPDVVLAASHLRIKAAIGITGAVVAPIAVLWAASIFSWPVPASVAVVTIWLMMQSSLAQKLFTTVDRRVSFLAMAGVAFGFFVGGTLALQLATISADRGTPAWLWLGLIAVAYAALLLGRISARRALQIASQSEILPSDTPVTSEDSLYLRSFGDDRMRVRSFDPVSGALAYLTGGGVRFEELVAAGSARGHTIAFGRPGEPLPELGSTRFYVDNDNWQDLLKQVADRAGSIHLVAGSSESLGWEVAHLRRSDLLHKCLILLPPLPQAQSWRRFHTVLNQLDLGLKESTEHADGVLLNGLIPTIIGIGVSSTGRPVFYASERRDWLAYFGMIHLHQGIARGTTEPPLHGSIGKLLFPELELEPQ